MFTISMPDLARLRTTWDGLFISAEPPYGANIVVLRRAGGALEYLILRRAHAGRTRGDWVWGPPAGCRMPGEEVEGCAARELDEETGLRVPLTLLDTQDDGWVSYWAEVGPGVEILLSDEHDAFEWVTLDEAMARCQPAIIGRQLELASRAATAAAA